MAPDHYDLALFADAEELVPGLSLGRRERARGREIDGERAGVDDAVRLHELENRVEINVLFGLSRNCAHLKVLEGGTFRVDETAGLVPGEAEEKGDLARVKIGREACEVIEMDLVAVELS